jgi:hypothetical protein
VQYDGIAAPNAEIWSAIGRENLGLMRWCSAHRFEYPNCRFEERFVQRDSLEGLRTTLFTPAGNLERTAWYDPTYHSLATEHHFVRRPEDYRILLAYLRDVQVVEDTVGLRKAIAELGDDGLPLTAVARTPYQQLWVQWVSLTDLCIHLVDIPKVMEEVIGVLADIERRIFRVVRAVSERIELPFVDIPDNITAPTIGPANFRRYCLPLYQELSAMMAERGVRVIAHMDGDLKPLWDLVGQTNLGGIDSFSPQPDNDTRVSDAVRLWPQMRVFLNFPSSVHIGSPEQVYRTARQILEEGGHTGRIWIQVSENVPPGVWRSSFPMIVKAIREFGAPRPMPDARAQGPGSA